MSKKLSISESIVTDRISLVDKLDWSLTQAAK